ncbi:MAG: hypothetical protein H6712_07940 [Myxococcales bacterium]|nr:hypothetical protein [Myxococcales bacterium]MCB9713768.1 hypothetical protein [Myxococcales bacterium]
MKLFNSMMGALLVVPMVLAGCPGDDSTAETTTDPDTGNTTATTQDMTTTGMTSADSSGSSGGPMTDCQDPREIPAAPVDCSGVDGTLDGSAIIEEGGDDPSILEGIRVVTGSIQLNRTDLTNLDFMACVQEVGGEVNIYDNDMLTNVDGLWSLTMIGTHFVFSENSALVDFDGMPNVQVIGTSETAEFAGNLIMKNNDALETISGFHSLVGVNNNLTIQTNPVLTNIDGLGGLRVVGNILAITANPMLCLSSVNCVGTGIVMPATPPDSWSTQANDPSC